jgi:hypothetical protein
MKRILLIPTIALATLTTVCASANLKNHRPNGQQHDKCYGLCFYEEVLDRVFPQEAFDGRKEIRLIIFRVLPSRLGEWQVVIREKHDGRFELIYYESPKEGNIFSYIGKTNARQEEPDLEATVRGLHVEARTIDPAPKDLESRLRSFLEMVIPTNLETAAELDGAQYELWEKTVSENIHVSIGGNEPYAGAKLAPLAQWMVEVTNLAKGRAHAH